MLDNWEAQVVRQRRGLPRSLQTLDLALVKVTELCLVIIGGLFATMISLEVVSRYVFDFSVFFVSAAARFLLLWFFLVGAGLALRIGAHVGFELLVRSVNRRFAAVIRRISQILALVFFAQMTWAGVLALEGASTQVDSALNLNLFWGFLAVPVGFGLLIYHMIVVMISGEGAADGQEGVG